MCKSRAGDSGHARIWRALGVERGIVGEGLCRCKCGCQKDLPTAVDDGLCRYMRTKFRLQYDVPGRPRPAEVTGPTETFFSFSPYSDARSALALICACTGCGRLRRRLTVRIGRDHSRAARRGYGPVLVRSKTHQALERGRYTRPKIMQIQMQTISAAA